MLYSKKREWFFVHVPKNAGTAVLWPFHRAIKSEAEREEVIANRKSYEVQTLVAGHHHNKASFWSNIPELKGLEPVALLRNPWDRALSIYTYNLKYSAQNLDKDWARIDHATLTKQGFKKAWMPGGFFVDEHGRNFEYNQDTGRAWAQDEDQYSWLEGLGKWFRIEDQMQEFCIYTGLPYPNRINTTKRGDYRGYFDDELTERIGDLFARDIVLGGYKF